MKITLESTEDAKAVKWDVIAETIKQAAIAKIAEALKSAAKELQELAPGETRKISVTLGEIEISRQAENCPECGHREHVNRNSKIAGICIGCPCDYKGVEEPSTIPVAVG